jgi:hypothetical protein
LALRACGLAGSRPDNEIPPGVPAVGFQALHAFGAQLESNMPTIIAGNGVITQVNVFTTTPDKQQPLIDLLIEAANWARPTPGWMSASLHRSLDGTRVVNYAQCSDIVSWQAVMERLKEGDFFARNKSFGTAAPGLYDVVYTLER